MSHVRQALIDALDHRFTGEDTDLIDPQGDAKRHLNHVMHTVDLTGRAAVDDGCDPMKIAIMFIQAGVNIAASKGEYDSIQSGAERRQLRNQILRLTDIPPKPKSGDTSLWSRHPLSPEKTELARSIEALILDHAVKAKTEVGGYQALAAVLFDLLERNGAPFWMQDALRGVFTDLWLETEAAQHRE